MKNTKKKNIKFLDRLVIFCVGKKKLLKIYKKQEFLI